MKRILVGLLCSTVLMSCSGTAGSDTLDLSGKWEVSLDSLKTFSEISLPGTTDLAGLGTPETLEPAMKPAQLAHLARKNSFIGEAFYRRKFIVLSEMAGKPLALTMERIIWQSRVWIDGKLLPSAEESLTTPHVHSIPPLPEGEHEIMVRIDNRKRYNLTNREMAHSYTEETQIKWNGILGRIELSAVPAVKIDDIRVYPDIEDRSIRVLTTLVRTEKVEEGTLALNVKGFGKKELPVILDKDTVKVDAVYFMGKKAELWDEFSPVVYTLDASFGDASYTTDFGLREIDNKDAHININGRRVFMRGTLDCCIFPLTGNPPTDEAGWEKVFNSAKEWGINHFRYHSYCPPEAAFKVADRMGFYLQVELPQWTSAAGVDDALDAFITEEFRRIIASYGNHPSFVMLSCGNELSPGYEFLNNLVGYMKSYDPRRLYVSGTASLKATHLRFPETEDMYYINSRTKDGNARGQSIFNTFEPDFSADYQEAVEFLDVPFISHEAGQYAVYPNMMEIDKYTGVLDPINFRSIKADLEQKGLIDKADAFTDATGKFAAILYKEEVERALRTPGYSGIQLLGLQDFPGQSTALVGLIDSFWDSKDVVTPEWFRQCCSPVVPLARFKKAVWKTSDTFTASLEVADFGPRSVAGKPVDWTLTSDGKILASGTGDKVEMDLSAFEKAARVDLSVKVRGTDAHNSWSFWVYPEHEIVPEDIVVTRDSLEAYTALSEGRKVLYSPEPWSLKGSPGKFLPTFWSPVFFPAEAGTMGILCDPGNPALAEFPTDSHSNWQWWWLARHSTAVEYDDTVTPIVEVIDNFALNRHLSYVYEKKEGEGRMVFSAIDVLSGAARERPEAQQLLYSLVEYLKTD